MGPALRSRHSARNPTACEQCRTARIKCQSSAQPGVCARCLATKKECITRIKPRPRRRGRLLTSDGEATQAQSPTYRHTFTIEYPLPARDDATKSTEALRDLHEHAITSILFREDLGYGLETTSPAASLSTASHRSTQSDLNANMWRQPEFDLASAEVLLKSFRSKLSYLPFLHIPDTATVSYLSSTKPFLLLAILTVASGSKMVHKHALYDDEFRKALSLQYVSGGERSLELLQGLLVYCAWYPFHLSPKDRQLVHCLRMAGDLVHDVQLDILSDWPLCREVKDEELDKVRAYLTYLYLCFTYGVVWKGERELPISRVSWTSIALETLQNNAQIDDDRTLVTLVHSSHLFASISETPKGSGDSQRTTAYSVSSMRVEGDFFALQSASNHCIIGNVATTMQAMFVDIFIDCRSMLVLPVSKWYSSTEQPGMCPPLHTLYCAVEKIKTFLDFVSELSNTSLVSFTINNWTQLIVVLTLSFRLSFPLGLCPEYDSAYARSKLQLGSFLGKMSQGVNTPTSQNDLLSSSRSVFGLAKTKYDIRSAFLAKSQPSQPPSRIFGCPIMGGTSSISTEPAESGSSRLSAWFGDEENGKAPMFHDIWTTMTMGW